MPRQDIRVYDVQQAVDKIIPYLEGTAHKAVYFDGWNGLGASAVLRAIAKRPPPSLTKKFDKIIHIDCSRWESRRALQKAIVDELKLPGHVVAHFDRQDEEDDFSEVEHASRAEIRDVTREINRTLRNLSYVVIFHNGSDNMVDMADFGIFQFECPVLWTFRGRFRLNEEIQKKVDSSHFFVDASESFINYRDLIEKEAREITLYTLKHGLGITPEVARDCYVYLLSLNYHGGKIIDYSWATHAANYWVCDGIVGGDKVSQAAWDVARALHQEIRLEDYSSNTLPVFGHLLYSSPPRRWHISSDMEEKAYPETTSLFLAPQKESDQPLPSLPIDMFQQAVQLCVLKLCGCTFNFSSPPFHCCYNLRFLGLDGCMDQENLVEEKKEGAAAMEIFRRLWVLDVCQTNWELAFPEEIQEQADTNIREIHIRKGRIWRSSLSWRQLQSLHKIQVAEPTSSWATGKKDEFTDMINLELLHLSANNSIQVLPSLCGATRLKTLVLDGCAGLEHVGPEELPLSLESFSLDGGATKDGNNPAKISRITLAGCAKLVDFKLLGSLPNLVELDLSCTAVKTLNLKKEVQVENLERILLMGCYELRAIVWLENGMKQLRFLHIDTRQWVTSPHSIVWPEKEGYCQSHVSITDMRFLQSLVLTGREVFCWSTTPFKLNLYLSCSIKDDEKNRNRGKVAHRFENTGQIEIAGSRSVVNKSLTSNTFSTYSDVSIEQIVISEDNDSTARQFEPQDLHIEMGQEMVDINVANSQGIEALYFVMDKVQSLHLHDNSSVSSVISEHMTSTREEGFKYHDLKWCCVEKCPKLDTVFYTNYDGQYFLFEELETFWAADLLMAHSIWSRGRVYDEVDEESFAKLKAIHLHRCTRIKFVLPLSWNHTLSSLETLHIVWSGDLRQIFPVEADFRNKIATQHPNGMLEFPRLKDLYLYHLSSLRQICEAKMFAPKLETVRLKGCWGLKRLPATSRREHDAPRVIVDCEKDWWDNLEWDGLDVGHHPSLFAPSHPAYYKKRMLRGSVLR